MAVKAHETVQVALGGMTCDHCVATVEQALLGVDGVRSASADLETQSAQVEFDPASTGLAALESAAAAVGYGARPSGGLVGIGPAAPPVTATAKAPRKDEGHGKPEFDDLVLRVEGMTCASCVRSVERAALEVPGVTDCAVSLTEATARVRLNRSESGPDDVAAAIGKAGYAATLEDRPSDSAEDDSAVLRRRLTVSAALTVPLLVLAMSHGKLDVPGSAWIQFGLALPVVLYGGAPFYTAAWHSARHLRSDMNTLIAIGTGASFAYSVVALLAPQWVAQGSAAPVYFETAAAILTLVLLGRVMEARARRRTSAAIRKLLALQPRTVRLRRGGAEVEVPLEEVALDDEVVVRPGDRVPVDGTVVEGTGAVDESPITGESVPADKAPGSKATSGSLNMDGLLVIRAESVGSGTVLARIVEFVRRAQTSKAPAARLADRIAGVFVPIVLAISAATFAAWMIAEPDGNGLQMAVNSAVSVLIIACPCALGLATPAALAVGIGHAAENGILVRDGGALEAARDVSTVVFDKTGTLTLGRMRVTDALTFGRATESEWIAAAGAIERLSVHPIAKAIVELAFPRSHTRIACGLRRPGRPRTRPIAAESAVEKKVTEYRALPGAGASARVDGESWLLGKRDLIAERGIDASAADNALEDFAREGKTVVLVARNGALEGVIGLRDTLRPGVREATADLAARSVSTVLLSGDTAAAAKAVAAEAGIDEVLAPVLPIEKSAAIERLQANGRVVAMVGDGINDAPALAQADLGFAIGSGADVAVESAGIILVRNDPSDVGRAIRLAQRTQRAIAQNYVWAFGYNVLGIPIAAGALYPWTGLLLSPILASAAMALSSLSVLTNSLRLRRVLAKRR